MYPRLTFRGLHTDRLEAFAADHRLAFRGLPAECPGDHSHEAASSSILPDRATGVSGSPRREGLSLAAPWVSNPEGWFLGLPIAVPMAFFGTAVSAASCRTSEVRLATISVAGGAASLCRTALIGGSKRQGALQELLPRRGIRLCGTGATSLGRGISFAATWIYVNSNFYLFGWFHVKTRRFSRTQTVLMHNKSIFGNSKIKAVEYSDFL